MSLAVPTTPDASIMPKQDQGIQGVVQKLGGNQMPTVGSTVANGPQPIQTTVWIFSGQISNPGSPQWPIAQARQHPSLLGWVKSDTKGVFSVGLPSGEYTLFAEYGANLYLNSFLGNANYQSVQVIKHQITELNLVNTEDASF
ncbi:hypothetical protein H6F76_14215 [Leptolyngbya sp. FACHB-321]|uniref:hypothetical protein n=1 Tax=Leptolyngbya sp. FACHB-321 TaxID=2692807 RepID=UPI001689FA37|nr:hypothetical protein [Leptolyngbya sp. FACHB-321]MBD2036172.1 hypothetical protein [Leptolyngbya sp. FACHB-321]